MLSNINIKIEYLCKKKCSVELSYENIFIYKSIFTFLKLNKNIYENFIQLA